MTKPLPATTSRWNKYRERHNAIRARKNGLPMQRIIRSVTSCAIRLWRSGEFSVSMVTQHLSRLGFTLPNGIPPASDVPQGTGICFYDAEHFAIKNGFFLRFIKSTLLKARLVILTDGTEIRCCPAIYCRVEHDPALPIPELPLKCDQCGDFGTQPITCESCEAPRFMHM